jgi:hypothetical protein
MRSIGQARTTASDRPGSSAAIATPLLALDHPSLARHRLSKTP